MSSFSKSVLLGVAILLVGCGSDRSETPYVGDTPNVSSALSPAQGYVFPISWPSRSDAEIADSAAAVAKQFNATLIQSDVIKTLNAKPGHPVSFGNIPALDGAELMFSYRAASNELRIARDISVGLPGEVISESSARAQASAALLGLSTAGILDVSQYETVPTVSLVKTARGVGAQTIDEQVDEYRYTYQRSINGISFPHAGVKVGISARGVVRMIRVGGAEVSSTRVDNVEVPKNGAAQITLDVTENQALARFKSDHPDAKIFSSTVSYTMNSARTQAEPRLLIAFANTTAIGADTSMSRRKRIAYPLRKGGEVVDYDPAAVPGLGAMGDAK